MSTYNLDKLFLPGSIAVVGASPRKTSSGRAVIENLLRSGFPGPIYVVNPHYDEIEGVHAVKSYEALPETPDVAVIAVPPASVPDAVAAAARKGTAAGIIVTAGLGHGPGSLAELAEKNARAASMRLVGPNCLGVLVPGAKLNASFAASAPPAGDLALISQSGAIATGLVEWAAGPRCRFFGHRVHRRQHRRRFRRPARSLRVGPRDAGDLALHRVDPRCAQVHVGGARRGADQASACHQVRAPRPGCEGGADAHWRACRLGCGL